MLHGDTFLSGNLVSADSSNTVGSHGGAIYISAGTTGTVTLNTQLVKARLESGNIVYDPLPGEYAPIAFSGNRIDVDTGDPNAIDPATGTPNAIHLDRNTALLLKGDGNIYFDDPISSGSGNNSLTKEGSGFVQFLGHSVLNTVSFAGTNSVDIKDGTFRLANDAAFDASGAGKFNVASGAILAGQGTITAGSGGFTISGTLSPDSDRFAIPTFDTQTHKFATARTDLDQAKKIGTLTLKGDVQFNGATLNVDIIPPTAHDKIAVQGAVTFGPLANTVTHTPGAAYGTYDILTSTSDMSLTDGNFTVTGTDLEGYWSGRGSRVQLRADNSKVLQLLLGTPQPLTLTWTGAEDAVWESTGTAHGNWTDRPGGTANETFFRNGDSVIFNSLGTHKNLTVADNGVTVNTMAVNDDYNFTGGAITATGAVSVAATKRLGLVVRNEAALNADTVNLNTTGRLNVTGYIPDESSPHSGPKNALTVISTKNGVSNFDVNNIDVAGRANADFMTAAARLANADKDVVVDTRLSWYSGNAKAHGNFTIPDSQTFILSAILADETANAAWDGKTLTKKGGGTLILSGANTYTGMTTVQGGVLALGSNLTASGGLTLYGGATFKRGAFAHSLNNKTLIVRGEGATYDGNLSARGASMSFIAAGLPGGSMLGVTGTADVTGGKVKLNVPGNVTFGKDTRISLLKAAKGLTGIIARGGTVTAGALVVHDVSIQTTANEIIATVGGGKTQKQTKALAEGSVGTLGLAIQGADVAAGPGLEAALRAVKDSKKRTGPQTPPASGYLLSGFGAVSGGSLRYNSGSHVDMNSVSLLTGLALGTDLKSGHLTLGAFFEFGNGSYDTHNSFSSAASVDGDGSAWYIGGGLLGRMDFNDLGPGHLYLEGTTRAGKVHNDYDSDDLRDSFGSKADYETSAYYYGLHLGAGYIWDVTDDASLDVYAKYFWTRQEGAGDTLSSGERVYFKNADSHRARAGARFTYVINEHITPYIGAAFEHEFDGEARATVNGFKVDAPDLKGNTGIGELGLSVKPSATLPLFLDLGAQGYVGKREGVTGSLQVRWEF